ncbi:MAG: hypothetical protein GTO40_03580, partial [Deltaproteobacteria bacterium]|nr:hypothetical protein [Deltaproteobacteria bacterium]
MQLYQPQEVIVETGLEHGIVFNNLKMSLPDTPFTLIKDSQLYTSKLHSSPNPLGEGKKRLLLTRHKGEFLKKCPGTEGSVCCNYFVINFASNCPMDCSYCYLQDYL